MQDSGRRANPSETHVDKLHKHECHISSMMIRSSLPVSLFGCRVILDENSQERDAEAFPGAALGVEKRGTAMAKYPVSLVQIVSRGRANEHNGLWDVDDQTLKAVMEAVSGAQR